MDFYIFTKVFLKGKNMNEIQSLDAANAEAFKYLLVTSNDVVEADKLLSEEFPNWNTRKYESKMEYLAKNFIFSLSGCRFTLEQEPEKIAKEDYFATLHYLITEAKNCGIKSIIKG
jgi:hypothetical protein